MALPAAASFSCPSPRGGSYGAAVLTSIAVEPAVVPGGSVVSVVRSRPSPSRPASSSPATVTPTTTSAAASPISASVQPSQRPSWPKPRSGGSSPRLVGGSAGGPTRSPAGGPSAPAGAQRPRRDRGRGVGAGRPAGEHRVQAGAEAVDVGPPVGLLAADHLRGEEAVGAEDLAGAAGVVVGGGPGDREVGHLHGAVVGQQ